MTNVNKIIEELRELPSADYFSSGAVYLSDVEDLIHKHLDGYALVPIEPTGYMIAEGLDNFNPQQSNSGSMYDAYKAMISAKGESNE